MTSTPDTDMAVALRDRVPALDENYLVPIRLAPILLALAKVHAEDAVAYGGVRGMPLSLDVSRLYLWRDVTSLSGCWPQVSVRACVGWALVNLACWDEDHVGLVDRAQPWADVGLVETGWLFAAAGVSPAEAVARADVRAGDEGAMATLAGLRGVTLPVTT